MPDIEMVCLANSRKLSGRCIAGREVVDGKPGQWIRPVGSGDHGAVTETERHYSNGSDPKVLDVIRIPITTPSPHGCQSENWSFDTKQHWKKTGTVAIDELKAFESPITSLWGQTGSTFHGLNDQIPVATANTLKNSLVLIKVRGIKLKVFAPGANFNDHKRKVQAQFTFETFSYHLSVTDPVYEKRYLKEKDGEYKLGPSYLTISIAEPFNGNCYKLVAAIIEI